MANLDKLKIEPIPMSLGAYIDRKLSQPHWFYGSAAVISILSGAVVAWLIGAP